MSNIFPDRLREGARTYINQTIAFAQVRLESGTIKVRLQAIEIMKRFEGDVTYGSDPRGILFYDTLVPFRFSTVEFTYQRHSDTPSNFATIQINFRGRGESKDFARFVARVDTTQYKIPHLNSGNGVGRWYNFKIATTEASAFRSKGSLNVTIQFGPVRREVTFPSGKTTQFEVNGLLMFRDIGQLKDVPLPHDKRNMHVQTARDLCVFRFAPNSGSEHEFGIFLPNVPLDLDDHVQPPQVKWYDYTPDLQALAHEREDTPDVVEEGTT